ncbi:MAG TPA: hypothetical protein VJ481_02735 [Patescibacteria group bacterium]|nr:hypothetical protein [Patescibacteria group bacterium]
MKKESVIGILILLGLVYWFAIRPSNIRSHCHNLADENARIWATSVKDGKESEIYDRSLEKCINEKGLR